MPPRFLSRCAAVCAIACVVAAKAAGGEGGDVRFETHVLPILEQNCLFCHSHEYDAAEGGLVLDSPTGWAAGGGRGPAIRPGDPDGSVLMRAVEYETGVYDMPPDGKLTAAEIETLRTWIARGADDPREGLAGPTATTAAGPSAAELWSVRPLAGAPAPAVPPRSAAWPRGEVDRHLLAGLTGAGLEPAADAPPHMLLNRLHDVLTGLPPTPGETTAFLAAAEDDLDAALAGRADALLASPHFGVRWGRHWLDVARYADAPGATAVRPYPQAWRYRNYVFLAFNDDKPWDEFAREQLAGDLLPAADEADRAENRIATGFLALAHVPSSGRDPEKLKLDTIDEQLDVIGTAFLGVRIGCARCHDHKLDPFPTRDYYALAGVLRSTEAGPRRGDILALRPPGELPNLRGAGVPAFLASDPAAPTSDRKPKKSTRYHGAVDAAEVRDEPIHPRGDVELHGEIVPRGFPSLVEVPGVPAPPPDASGRAELAEWLVGGNNPLVARVLVNRVWQHVFGAGIVRSSDNFGLTGDPPSHPALLDALVRRFTAPEAAGGYGWRVKPLVRDLTLSRAWRQSGIPADNPTAARAAEVDPDNRLLWRSRVRRRDAEAVVDSIRFVAGELDEKPAGRTAPEFRAGNQDSTADLPIPAATLRKRVAYWPVFRKDVPVAMDLAGLLDLPPATAPRGTRGATAVPGQSLALLNSPITLNAARALSREVRTWQGDEAERLARVYLRLFARRPSVAENAHGLRFLDAFSETLAEHDAAKPANVRNVAWNRLLHALLVSNEFLVVE